MKQNATILINETIKHYPVFALPYFITVRENQPVTTQNTAFALVFLFHFKKCAKIHFFLYPQLVVDIFLFNSKKKLHFIDF